jgi:hypothetical protein
VPIVSLSVLIIFGLALLARINGTVILLGGTLSLGLMVGYAVAHFHGLLQQEQAPRTWYITLYTISGLGFAFGVAFLLRIIHLFGLL